MKKTIIFAILIMALMSFSTSTTEISGIKYCFGGGSNFSWSVSKQGETNIYKFTFIHDDEGVYIQYINAAQAEFICHTTSPGMEPMLPQ